MIKQYFFIYFNTYAIYNIVWKKGILYRLRYAIANTYG